MSEEIKSASEQKKEDWMNSKWRPMMGWMYMLVCTADFIIFPVLWSLLQTFAKIGQITQWNPLTLQGAGLFHIAMGAVLGLAAFGRTQEKIAGANNGGLNIPVNNGFSSAPSTMPVTNSFGSQSSGGSGGGSNFGSARFETPQHSSPVEPSWGSPPLATTASGKKLVPTFDQPVL